MRRKGSVLLVGLLLVVLVAGCIGGGNFVYSKDKVIGPHEELKYPFKGPVNLDVEVSGNGPFTLMVVSSDGSRELLRRENVSEVKETVKLPDGSWKVIIKNDGDGPISLDISLRGK